MPMKPPLFVCSDDVYAFASKEEAESFLEPVDVEPDERGYDAEGRLIRVVARGEVRQGRGWVDQSRARVELVLAEEEPSHREELRTQLAEWLRRAGQDSPTLETASLEQLVERAASHAAAAAAPRSIRNVKVTIALLVLGVVAVWWWLTR